MSDLPPLHDDLAYVVVAENDQRGPYQLEVLITEVLGGRIHESTPIWWPGLAEWTTIAGHPGLAGEIQRRRDAVAASNPVVPPAVPAMPPSEPAPQPVQSDPTLGMFGQSVPQDPAPADPTQAPVYTNPGQDYSTDLYAGSGMAAPVEPAVEPRAVPEQAAPVMPSAEPVSPEPTNSTRLFGQPTPTGEQVPAEVTGGVDADVPTASPFSPAAESAPVAAAATDAVPAPEPAAELASAPVSEPALAAAPAPAVSALDPVAARNYSSLVDRSRLRSEHRARIQSVDEQFVVAVQAAATGLGFRDGGRTDTDQAHNLRLDGPTGDLLLLELGRINATAPSDLSVAHVPTTLTYRAAATATTQDPGTGAHGEVRVAADQWTGQATATVALVLGLEDYLDATLSVDQAAVARDLSAAVGVLRDRAR
jgi:hypothetical protein